MAKIARVPSPIVLTPKRWNDKNTQIQLTEDQKIFLDEVNEFNLEVRYPHFKDEFHNIEQAILFGSYAQGTYTSWSDIDLALVSSDFEGDRFKDRDKIRRIKLKISSDLEPIPYSPNAFTADDPFVKQILTTGINVTPHKGGTSSVLD